MSLKHLIAVIILTSIAVQSRAQNLGFVQQENIKTQNITTDAQINGLSVTQKQTTRVYYDGLGRTLQSIGVQASPGMNDLIQPVAYDNLGRQTVSYLPYAGQSTDVAGSYRTNAISTAQPAFYNQTSQYIIPVDTAAHVRAVFENSPLQRLLTVGKPGGMYQPTGSGAQYNKTAIYRVNLATMDGNILIWNSDGTFTTGAYYNDNSLSVTIGKDEDSTETRTFTDMGGRTILKRQILPAGNLDTYYIYNNAGMLVYIIPPKAMTLMAAASSYSLTVTGVNKLYFHFVYDTMGRPVEKTVPAKGTMYIVYDPLNRPVLMQDASMLGSNKWSYIKYDAEGRAISQGIYTDNTTTPTSHIGRVNMQAYVNNIGGYATAWYESRTSTLTNGGYYTNTIFPTTTYGTLTPLVYAYYDDYRMTNGASPDFTYSNQSLTGEVGATTAAVRGMPTVTCKTTIGSGITGSPWLTTVTFYDKRGNPVQTKSNNQLYYTNATTVLDIKTMVPDFAGVPQISKVSKQTGTNTTVTVQTTLAYDHMYRVNTVSQAYNGGASIIVAAYAYNELGQVVKKSLGYVNSTTYLQNVDMRYNIRGQLLSINNSKLTSDTGKTNADSNDAFGMQMLYDQQDSKLSNKAYHNGKLSAVKWMSTDGSGNKSYERAFKYYYDNMGRDTAAIYAERTALSTSPFTTTHGWDENRITYDPNGNILTMFRDSTSQGSGGHTPIDNLSYTYDPNNPNQLQKVTDGIGSAYTNSGFRNRTGSTGNYTYDVNGNLTGDPYKGFSSIAYNVLNRTDKITFTSSANRYIDYTYDAGGNLIRKRQYDNVGGVATLQNTTDYIDGFVYVNSTLSYFPMPEGRVLFNAGTFTKEFIITDPQGNARVSFNNTGTGGTAKVVQENSYYAFGLIMPGSVVGITGNTNKNLYNGGSEWQNDYSNLPDYYQTFNRNYDAALGRWIGVDPVAESAESMTSYQYAGNNPVMLNDPMGDKLPSTDIGAGITATQPDQPNNFRQAGPLNPGWQDGANFGGAPVWGGAGAGLYYSNPDAYWALYRGTGGTLVGTTPEVVQAVVNSIKTGLGFDIWVDVDGKVDIIPSNSSKHYLYRENQDETSWTSQLISGANQGGYPVGLHQFLAIEVGESGGNFNATETKAIGSSMINRINQAGTSLYDPNWLKKISYGGNTKTNFVAINGHNVDYNAVMGMSMSQIMNSSNPVIQAAISSYNNWGTDYSNPKGFADTGSYFWNATGGLGRSTYNATDYVITLTAGGTTFYRPR